MTEVWTGPNSWVEHTRIQRESEAGVSRRHSPRWIRRATATTARSPWPWAPPSPGTTCMCGSADEHFETLMYGLYLTRGEQVVDNHTGIYHDHPNCRSWEVYKGMLDGRSRGGVQRQGVRQAGGPEDRRQADQPESAALRSRQGRHQAAARDLRRRREVHPRRHGRPAGRGGALLRPEPRRAGRRGASACSPTPSLPRSIEEVALEPVRKELERLVRERIRTGKRADRRS